MNPKIIECVPNISEGKNLEVVQKCIQAIESVKGVRMIDSSSDPDHNRSVLTFIGPVEEVLEAAYQLTVQALQLIDLRTHSGTHPRMGAVDVIPIIPLVNITMEECIQASEQLAKRVGNDLNLPVYLYANSAKSENRKKLPSIRKGEFEGFDKKIIEKEWTPDYGPTRKHTTAGVVAIGAREFLIAYNIYLDTTDEKIAESIARSIRESGGGHKYLQAKGMFISEKNMAQVSMNILDFNKLPLYRVIELVRLEAKRYGVTIKETELIGLIPIQAVLSSFAYYAQLPMLDSTQVIEMKL
ncbi:glutamate formimidoyltransferase [bacterium]|nr:glutamate formimidoyltransferase [bacterium]